MIEEMIIYKATFPNGKSYIGQTQNSLASRRKKHLYSAFKKNSAYYFHNALRKYGEENVSWEILEECPNWESMQEREKFFIKEHNTLAPNGYNTSDGGRQPKYTKEIGAKRSGDKHHKFWLGKSFTNEHKEKIRQWHKGKKKDYLKLSRNAKKSIVRIGKDGSEKAYDSITKAVQENHILGSSISNVLSGRAKTAGGFYWKLT